MGPYNVLSRAQAAQLAAPFCCQESYAGEALDITDYDGVGLFILNVGYLGGDDPTLDVQIEHSDDGLAFSDVAGGAFGQVTREEGGGVVVDGFQSLRLILSAIKRYVRADCTLGGADPNIDFTVTLIGIRQAS